MLIEENKWQSSQISYWDSVAHKYDGFYESQWSRLENLDIQTRLKKFANAGKDVLDIGCGTGLGYEILASVMPIDFNYLGLDISDRMIHVAKQKFPHITFSKSSMNNLIYPSQSFDMVMSLFSAFSYEEDSTSTISEIYRVLRPGGICFISMFNRFSLRRLINTRFAEVELYSTRGDSVVQCVPTKTFSIQTAKNEFQNAGFNNVQASGQGLFSGVLEHPCFWSLDKLLSRICPDLTHMIVLTGRK